MNRIIRRLVWMFLALIGIGIFLPFGAKIAGSGIRTTVDLQLLLYQESGKLNLQDEDSLAICLWEFVAQRIRNPLPEQTVADTGWVHVLAAGIGSCDQQGLILIRLARSYGIDGRLVFLFGENVVSKHSVAELKVEGHWVMLDPFYGTMIFNDQGRAMGVADLISYPELFDQGQRRILKGHGIPDEKAFRALFGKRVPFQVFLENDLSPAETFWYKLAKWNSFLLGKVFDWAWETC